MKLALLLALALPLGPAAFVQDTPPEKDVPEPKLDLEELKQRVESFTRTVTQREGLPGMSVAVAKDGEVLVSFGAGARQEAPATGDTRYAIGTLSRQFTAVAILQLADAKKLSLDDELSKHLPELKLATTAVAAAPKEARKEAPKQANAPQAEVPPNAPQKVLLRHVLSNTAGIASSAVLLEKHPELATGELDEKRFLACFSDVPLAFEPGSDFTLDHAGYSLLALVVAKVSGQSYVDYVRENVLKAAGLEHTDFSTREEVAAGVTQDCTTAAVVREIALPGTKDAPVVDFSLSSNAPDLVKWQRALFLREVFSEEASRHLMTPTELPDGNSTNYGYALAMGRLGDFKVYAHTGGIAGQRVRMAYYAKPAYTIVVLADCDAAPVERLEREIARHMLQLPAPGIVDLEVPAEVQVRADGTYQIATTRIRIFFKEGKLYYEEPARPAQRLLYQGELRFVFQNDHDVQITFDPADARASWFEVTRMGFVTRGKRMG